ncbi:MAG: hypothetical protein KJ856_05895 [Gammaproteobacteria bacterium]|uniref:Peptidase C39 domain-containing protein n=1 Tax=viral metagenome TaxID=1070528 RepID=A0A6H1ZYH9_9ZZZZ|nr:hypothetical protein [Gammaproteobacteria bacterium]MBU2002634.1 hypothetical protein [Gammaproteobacteria bacterium]MBU2131809.1 hypothetical protein [Gammaproteobacteria bacterium]MBU2186544.1 hypothetical protein [Gammaproteobacteria bacterium]MBU2297285.1 hypothetical protein [Gammaproteobacteria bacterium]
MGSISFVQQPTLDTCTSACLSMITGVDVNDVIRDFHDDWKSLKSNPSEFLSHRGIRHVVNKDVFSRILNYGFAYLLTVPSLNLEGGLHHIILDLSDALEKVYDPNQGKEGKRYYVGWSMENVNELEVKLHSWMVDIKFEIKGIE